MIDLSNGDIRIESAGITLNSKLTRQIFEKAFPKQDIRNTDDMKNGYLWYYVYGTIFTDKILIAICFAPSCHIEYIGIYPQVAWGDKQRSWVDWSEDQMNADKKLCDIWLKTNCGLEEKSAFIWGKIQSICDRRSGSSGIVVRYH